MSEIEDRISEKIEELERYLREFDTFDIPEFEEYVKDIKIKAACERYFEKIVETVISITLLIIREKNLKSPESEEHAFIILAKNNIISNELSEVLRNAKDMRNRIIHDYGDIDDEIVFEAVSREIARDAREFIKQINARRCF